LQDHRGFMWFATNGGGLHRYDGRWRGEASARPRVALAQVAFWRTPVPEPRPA
jgi:hypothetical protein